MARRARPVGRTASGVLALAVGLSLALPAGAAGKPKWISGQHVNSTVHSCVFGDDRAGVLAEASFRATAAPPEAGSDFLRARVHRRCGRRLRHPVRPASSGPAARGQARDLAPDTRALSLVRLTNFSDRSPLAYAGLPTACGPRHLRPPAQPNDQAGRALGAASGRGLLRRVSAPLEAPVEGHRVGGAIVSTCSRRTSMPAGRREGQPAGGRFRQRRRHEPVGRASRRTLRQEVAARGAPSRLAPAARAAICRFLGFAQGGRLRLGGSAIASGGKGTGHEPMPRPAGGDYTHGCGQGQGRRKKTDR